MLDLVREAVQGKANVTPSLGPVPTPTQYTHISDRGSPVVHFDDLGLLNGKGRQQQ